MPARMKQKRTSYIRGGTSYPPAYEVVIQGETVGLYDSYAAALAAFKLSCKARGLRVPKVALVA